MPRIAKAKTAERHPAAASVPPAESRAQLAAEAQHLRALAEATRAKVAMPELKAYVQSGCGPAYQRDYEAWMKHTRVAYAFEEAAHRLDQALASLGDVQGA